MNTATDLRRLAIMALLAPLSACAAHTATSVPSTPSELHDDNVDSAPGTPAAERPEADEEDERVRIGEFVLPRPVGLTERVTDPNGKQSMFWSGPASITLVTMDAMDDDTDGFCQGYSQGVMEGHVSKMVNKRVHLDVSHRAMLEGNKGCVVAGLIREATKELPVMAASFRYEDTTASVLCVSHDAVAQCAKIIDGLERAER